jgi:pimeloyl-ACP methyl ester carboxylesterase
VAGWRDKLSPHDIVRTATVLLMKDRAGRVGARGVSRLLEDLLAATTAPVHLVGHSYGCKVVMSALCQVSGWARPVESALLLQPAFSYLAFAADVSGLGAPGGYRPALTRSVQPIWATFSQFDEALTKYFHLAVRRPSDLGDGQIAGSPPSRYSAMGCFGPAEGPEVARVSARSPGTGYEFPVHARVLGVEASNVVSSHSDINNQAVWRMLLYQVLGQS